MVPLRVLPVIVVLVLALAAGVSPAQAQSSAPRLELGAQLSTLRLGDFGALNAGLGGRVSYDLAPWFAVEGELNLFPRDRLDVGSSSFTDIRVRYSRRRFEGFAGPKVGFRGERVGLFGKVQPGFAQLSDRGVDCVGDDCARVAFLLAVPEYRTEFALNLGGVVEYYPSPRTVARVDLGATMIRHRSLAPPCHDCTSRNFSSRVGFGVRF